MRRSICFCDPSTAIAGEEQTWKFIYTTAVTLPKGARLRFDLLSNGRDIDWEIPSTNINKASNVIYAKLDNGKIVQANTIEIPDRFTPQFEFVMPSEVQTGGNVTIVVGNPPKSKTKDSGNKAQTTAQRRRQFLLSINTSGKGNNFEEPEVFSLDIKGGELHSIRVLTPSFVGKNKRFDIILRYEDKYGNLTNNTHEDTLIELSYEHLRENLTWKLFVPETGFIALPNLYFNEVGIYTIQLRNARTKEIFRSPPIRCFVEGDQHLFWGSLHGESERIDSTENIESCLRHFRDEKALNFYSISPFESQEETPQELWKLLSQNVTEFDEEDRFNCFLGFSMAGDQGSEGVHEFIYAKDNKPILRRKDAKYSSLKKIYKSFTPKEFISIPTFTMGKGFEYDFKNFTPEFERVVEIYNSWGSSECTAKEGNTRPIKNKDKKGVQESAEGSIQKALQANCRFGFVGGGLDDRGIYADFFESDQEQYSPGLTAIIAPAHTRQALFDALYNRSCYATTGERIIIGLNLANVPMGGETSTAAKHGLFVNRHLSGYVAGTTTLEKVEIIRNGKVIKKYEPGKYFLEFTYDDLTPIEKVTIPGGNKKPPFVYYYIRVTQEDGHMAWSSPIWVDLLPAVKGERKAAKNAKKPVKEVIEEEVEEEEEEDFDDYEE